MVLQPALCLLNLTQEKGVQPEMIQSILNSLFGCAHQRTTFPMTPLRKNGAFSTTHQGSGAYVVCLDCGKEFSYDWKEMRLGAAVNVLPVPAQTPASMHVSQ